MRVGPHEKTSTSPSSAALSGGEPLIGQLGDEAREAPRQVRATRQAARDTPFLQQRHARIAPAGMPGTISPEGRVRNGNGTSDPQ